jgi:hypothetical protein
MLNLNYLKVRFSMAYQNILDEILDKVDEMPLEDQVMLVELIRNRYKEKRREEILANARQTVEEHTKGLTSKGTVSDLLRELEA